MVWNYCHVLPLIIKVVIINISSIGSSIFVYHIIHNIITYHV